MGQNNRTTNSIRNSTFVIIQNIANILLGFAYRTVFVMVLAKEYLGLNGLFTNILTFLSIAELGIGSAIVYRLYKPVSDDDKPRIIELMNFYKRVYMIVALAITVIGLAIMPFLKYLIADTSEVPEDINLYVIYVLFLLGQVSTYICVHKQSIIIADQKNWIISLFTMIGLFLRYAGMIIVLFITKNFTLVLVAQIVLTLLTNIAITILANRMYPYLKSSKRIIDKSERKEIYNETFALLNHRIGGVVVNGTDNLLISAFIGLGILGLYSNYSLILVSVISLLSQIVSVLSASVGNLYVNGTKEEVFNVYKRVQYINLFISLFIMTGFYLLINNFVELWLGSDYLLDSSFIMVVTLCNAIKLIRNTNLVFINACGLYMKDKWRPYIEVVINLVASIILVKTLGLTGIFIGTLISTLTVPFWREYYLLNKFVFKTKKIWNVVLIQTIAVVLSVALCVLGELIFASLSNSLGWFLIKIIICVITIPAVFIACSFYLPEFKYFMSLCLGIIKKILKKCKLIKG